MMKRILATATAISLMLVCAIDAHSNTFSEPQRIRCTCYTAKEGAITASGKKVREGLVSGKPEWMGYTAFIYECNPDGSMGGFIGFFEFADTGSADSLNEGTSIDVFRDSLEGCEEWIADHGDYVYLQVEPGKG